MLRVMLDEVIILFHLSVICEYWTGSSTINPGCLDRSRRAGGGGGRHHSGVAGVVVLLCPVSQLLLSESEQRSSHGRQARSHRGPLRQVRTLGTRTIYLRTAHMEIYVSVEAHF